MKDYGKEYSYKDFYKETKEKNDIRKEKIKVHQNEKSKERETKNKELNNKRFIENEKAHNKDSNKDRLKRKSIEISENNKNSFDTLNSKSKKQVHSEKLNQSYNVMKNNQEDFSNSQNKNKLKEKLNENKFDIEKFNKYLRENLYKFTEFSLSEKSEIYKITQNMGTFEANKKELKTILNKISGKEIVDYKYHYIENNSLNNKEYNEQIKNFKDKINNNYINGKLIRKNEDKIENLKAEININDNLNKKLKKKDSNNTINNIIEEKTSIINYEKKLDDNRDSIDNNNYKKDKNFLLKNRYEDKKGINDKRIKLNDEDLKKAWTELRCNGYTLRKISEKIDVDFKGILYRGYRINAKSLEILENLVGRKIDTVEKIENLSGQNRIYIKPSSLKDICSNLNKRGLSNNKISQEIGSYIGNILYQGYSLNQESFKKLEKLNGEKIPHELIEPKEKINESLKLERNEDLAEMICIILGDGHMHRKGEMKYKDSVLSISLNRVDEIEYVNYVNDFMKRTFKVAPDLATRKDSKSVDLKLYGDGLIDTLEELGLHTGDKIKNNVTVPDWIKKDEEWIKNNHEQWNSKYRSLVIRGIKGLIDTDGTIYVDKKNKAIGIGFRNASLPLIKDFKNMSQSLGIKSGKITLTKITSKKTGKILKGYQTLIRAKDYVKNFINIINPMKWRIKEEEINKTLRELGSSIDIALTKKY